MVYVYNYPEHSSLNPFQFYFILFEMRDQILTQYSWCRCSRDLSCGIIAFFFFFFFLSVPSLLTPNSLHSFWLLLSTKVTFSWNYSLYPQNLVAGWKLSALRSSFSRLIFLMCNALLLLTLNFTCHFSYRSPSLIKSCIFSLLASHL